MEDTLGKREKGHEAKYKLDQEQKFKALARRNKLIGLWAAERLGMDDPKAAAYAKEIVGTGFADSEGQDVLDKIAKDFQERGLEMRDDAIQGEMTRLLAVARDQVANEYPEPLGPDHAKVGDWPV
jgi:hypothetical protein